MGTRALVWRSKSIPACIVAVCYPRYIGCTRHPHQTKVSPNPSLKLFSSLRGLPPRFKRYLGAISIFGLGDFSHSLLILAATTILTPSFGVIRAAQVAGVLYVWRNVVQVVTSYPVGVLADRTGHLPVLIAGSALGALAVLLTALVFWRSISSVPVIRRYIFDAGLYALFRKRWSQRSQPRWFNPKHWL